MASVFIAADLPQCHAGDTKCMPEVIEKIISGHPKGHAGLSIPPLEPLRINTIDIIQGAESPINIDLHFKNLDMHGISKAKVTKVIGFEEDILNSKYEIFAKLPLVTIQGDYKINGRVLVLPIQGVGKSTLTFENVEIVFKYKPRIIVKNGKEYIQTEKFKLEFETAKFSLHFSNLFNGDKALGDNMNTFLNENWHDILDELKPSITSALEQILETIINRIFAKVPYKELYIH
ncbi:Protein takeout [Pseudolycoriella hygida]|uniref:Protein takeout n=1 Tax=Pseudolycoriella hygida TaxID=35572 RepID=A0A9Q0RXI0_9DIPT|nr:Protein takeout [Pseudolycoriella hygida]